jgi:putative ABC transport system substrate-binding protein
MRRRDFASLLCCAVATRPLAARAQQAVWAIGFLHQGAQASARLMASFRSGLGETGLVKGRNYTIENRSAEGQYDRLPALAAELIARQVAIIAADFLPAALAAKAASQSIPVVFVSGSDPIRSGLVTSLSRPTGNVTGIAFMFTLLGGKNLQLLREAVPKASVIGVLVNTSNPNAKPQLADLEAAGRELGQELVAFGAATDREIDSAYAKLVAHPVGALIVTADGFLISRQDQLISLAARYSMPTMYPLSQYVGAGGLMSYGANLSEAFWQAGVYVGKILNGTKPTELPVLQSSKFELAVNLKTARALGLEIPPTILSVADEVIE